MYCSDRTIQQFVRHGMKPEKLAQVLTERVVEVEGLHRWDLDGIVVGEVLSILPHPNADRLRVVKTSVGLKTLTIVCGGTNLYEGERVSVALEGARVRWHGQGDKVALKNTSIRGIESEGMICAASELDLAIANTSVGDVQEPTILDLTRFIPKSKSGTSLAKALGLDDVRYEIDNKSLARRADLWGYWGVSREVAIVTSKKLNDPAMYSVTYSAPRIARVDDKKGCWRYIAARIDDVQAVESPWEVQRELLDAGLRPINLIVDLTNLVMIELGQPMHAFDARRVDRIVVRKAKKGETFHALNGKEYGLDQCDCVVTNGKDVLALAGIMGGELSGVQSDTTSIIVESATFEPVMVRKTSQRLLLRTDSSARFEKGQSVEMADYGMRRFLWLLKRYQPKARVEHAESLGQKKTSIKKLTVEGEWLDRLIGRGVVSFSATKKILHGLGMSVTGSEKRFVVCPPFWRNDIDIPEDIAEEVVRLAGLNQFAHALPDLPIDPPLLQHARESMERVRTWLVERAACSETESYVFDIVQSWRASASKIQVVSPIAQDCRELRNDLLPNVLEAVGKNLRFRSSLRLFEIGRVYLSGVKSTTFKSPAVPIIPDQPVHCVLALSGGADQYRQVRGIVEGLLAAQGIPVTLSTGSREGLDSRSCQMITAVNGRCLGYFGAVSADVLQLLDIKQSVVVADLLIDEIATIASHVWRYKKPSEYPPVLRDLTLVVPPHVLYQTLEKIFDRHLGDLLSQYELFDIYTPEDQMGNRSLSFHLVYQSAARTLTGQEVDEFHKQITQELEAELHTVVPTGAAIV